MQTFLLVIVMWFDELSVTVGSWLGATRN